MPFPRFVRVLRSFVPSLVLAAIATAPAEAGLGIGTPQPLDPAKIRAVRTQERVAGAANATHTLFVWSDARNGNTDIYGARVAHDGTVLDPNGIAIGATGDDESAPTVSWNGTNWLVAWEKDASIFAARVATDGEVLDPSPLPIADGPSLDTAPAAARLGDTHLIVWSTGETTFLIAGATVASDGSFDVAPATLTAGMHVDSAPAVAVNEPTALVAFTTDRNAGADVYGFRLERSTAGPPALVRLDASDVAISARPDREGAPDVGARVDGWFVAWEDSRNTATAADDIYAARIDPSGAVLDADGIRISDDVGDERDAAVLHDGNRWLVAWSRADLFQKLRVVTNGGQANGAIVDVSTATGVLGAAAFGGDPATPIVAWSDPEVGSSGPKPPQDVLGRVLASDLSLGVPFPIATQTPNQTQPAFVFGANRWFMAWVDDRSGPTEGRLRYAVTDSARFEAPSLVLDAIPRPGLDQQQPTVCFDGTNFNLYWSEMRAGHRQIAGARFTPGGGLIDTFLVTTGAWNHVEPTTALMTDGKVVVVWTDERVPGDRSLYARLVAAGALQDVEVAVATTPGLQEESPSLAQRILDPGYAGTDLVYQARTNETTSAIYRRSFFLEPELEVSSESVVREFAGQFFERPRATWNGESYAIVYQERTDNDGSSLYQPWIAVEGPFGSLASLPLGPGSYVPANTVAASPGVNHVALWSRLDGGSVDLVTRRSANFAEFADPAPIALTSDAAVDVPGAAAKGQSDRLGLAYLRNQADGEWQGQRLFGADARDTLVGKVLINEFSANPPSGAIEFVEYYNVADQDFVLDGWKLVVDGATTPVVLCQITARTPPGETEAAGAGGVVLGEPCGFLGNANYFVDTDLFDLPQGSPAEGKLPNRGARLQLFSPGGVLVDEVGYGNKGGAPVLPPIPAGIAPAARIGGDVTHAPGDSVEVTTSRLPNGEDTGSDANDWNSTTSNTAGGSNVGQAAQLGSSLFSTRVFWNPPTGQLDAVELYNPLSTRIDFTNWFLGSNDGTQRIGVSGSEFGLLDPLEKRVLRRGEAGGFTTDLDYLTVVYLYTPEFVRVEQMGWSRSDNQQPQLCMKREPDTGGFHDGYDWFTSGGQDNLFTGELRYVACDIGAPGTVDAETGVASLAFRGAIPNPSPVGRGALVFSVPGALAEGGAGGAAVPVRLRLVDVSGRVRATLVDGVLAPGEHRVPLAAAAGRLAAGVYYAELEVGGARLARPVVVVP